MGVSMVVNFRDETSEIAAEKLQVESVGMKYVGIPWNGHDEPSNRQVAQFLELVSANPDSKIFVHCKAGADRTGVMVAAYRIALEHKAVSESVAEMRRYHYRWILLPHLERYVRSLPQLLQTETDFSAYAPAAPS
jgi:protein-tyrosine phosphatase